MIPVKAKPEPADFDNTVRKKGLSYLRKKGIALDRPLPPKTKIEPYWQACLGSLCDAYDGVCAYLAVYLERETGDCSVDHFIAKSRLPGLAYEWSNYRLACKDVNGKKGTFDDVLDPFKVNDGWFCLELVSGRIFPCPSLTDKELVGRIQATISRLGLDTPGRRAMRAKHFSEYIGAPLPDDYFKRISPFVYLEAKRQGLLKSAANKTKI